MHEVFITKEMVNQEIIAIILEHHHMQDWIKNKVGEDRDKVLNAFVNKFFRAIKFDLEYDVKNECFSLLDDGVLEVPDSLIFYDLTEFISSLEIALRKQYKESIESLSEKYLERVGKTKND